jgi:hypothetical protein
MIPWRFLSVSVHSDILNSLSDVVIEIKVRAPIGNGIFPHENYENYDF